MELSGNSIELMCWGENKNEPFTYLFWSSSLNKQKALKGGKNFFFTESFVLTILQGYMINFFRYNVKANGQVVPFSKLLELNALTHVSAETVLAVADKYIASLWTEPSDIREGETRLYTKEIKNVSDLMRAQASMSFNYFYFTECIKEGNYCGLLRVMKLALVDMVGDGKRTIGERLCAIL